MALGSSINQVEAEELQYDDRDILAEAALSEHPKFLQGVQMDTLLSEKAAGPPLFLFMSCQKLFWFGAWEALTEHAASMTEMKRGLFECLLDNIESQHCRELVKAAPNIARLAQSKRIGILYVHFLSVARFMG